MKNINPIVNEYLNKNNNDPQKAYNEYIKYHLLSGNKLPEDVSGIRDFIKESQPITITKKNKTYNKKIIKTNKYNMTIEDVVNDCKRIIKDYVSYQHEAKTRESKFGYWESIQSAKILLSKITGTEYSCIDIP